jgi:hypothetical protein
MKEMKTIGALMTTLFSTVGGLLLITGQCETTEQLIFSFILMTGFALLTLLILKEK